MLQRRLARKKRRSKNYEKKRIKVARGHHKIDNTRKDFHFKVAHALCDAGDMVFMEDLDYRVSAKGMFGKHMLDAAFGQFRTIVKHICWKRGKFFAVVDARGTSQECPKCGAEVKKDLSIRTHVCPYCNLTLDRDVASGQVIRNRGMKLISTAWTREFKQPVQPVCRGQGVIPRLDQRRNPAREKPGNLLKVT